MNLSRFNKPIYKDVKTGKIVAKYFKILKNGKMKNVEKWGQGKMGKMGKMGAVPNFSNMGAVPNF